MNQRRIVGTDSAMCEEIEYRCTSYDTSTTGNNIETVGEPNSSPDLLAPYLSYSD